MSAITSEKKSRIFAEFGGKATNTGSIEGQIALLTERINHVSGHLQKNKKDFFIGGHAAIEASHQYATQKKARQWNK